MPRPPTHRTKYLRVRLTPEEYACLQHTADSAAVELSTLVRAQLMKAPIPRRARRVSVDQMAMGRLMVQIIKVGGNLNQAVKLAHTHGDLIALRNAKRMIEELQAVRIMTRAAMAP